MLITTSTDFIKIQDIQSLRGSSGTTMISFASRKRIRLFLAAWAISPTWGFTIKGFPSIELQRLQGENLGALQGIPRRDMLGGVLGGALLGGPSLSKAVVVTKTEPLADLAMVRIRLPREGAGREYVAVQLKIQGQGPFDFMVDSGLTTELITPHLQQSLGLTVGSNKIQGLAAGGSTVSNSLVELEGASLCCGNFAKDSELPLPKLHAVVTDFPQEHIDPKHDPVEGMIGMELLSQFDVDFDFPKNRLRLWQPGTTDTTGLVEIPAVVINETGLIGIRLSIPGATQPILGFLDCGATFSCINWKAAEVLGLPSKSDPLYKKGLAVTAVGVDGRLLTLPMVNQVLTFAGEAELDKNTGKPVGFASPPPQWKDWSPVQLAVGDLPAFSTLLGDGRTPYQGPAALIGLDVLAQRRVVLEAGRDRTRRRRVMVSPR